ncbi:unnamed protein product [Musa hybrid cultivar]
MASGIGESTPAASDRKKRALEALERRFAAEAERLQEHHHQEDQKAKRARIPVGDAESEQRKRFHSLERRSAAEAGRLQEPHHQDSRKSKRAPNSAGGSESEKHKEGHPTTSAASASSKKDEVHPVYSEISGIVHENLLRASDLKVPSTRDTVSKVINDIVQKGGEGSKYAKRGKSLRIDNWILLDNFVPKDDSLMDARLKALRSHSKRSKKHMSRRQHRKCGSFNLPNEYHNFDLFKPMHEMWKEYIVELLKEVGKKQLAECLLMADLHGAHLLVVECKTAAFKGINGIMIRETAETFGIMTQDNCFRVVPKMGSIFIFQADCWKITLHGDKLSKRPLNRKNTHRLAR